MKQPVNNTLSPVKTVQQPWLTVLDFGVVNTPVVNINTVSSRNVARYIVMP